MNEIIIYFELNNDQINEFRDEVLEELEEQINRTVAIDLKFLPGTDFPN